MEQIRHVCGIIGYIGAKEAKKILLKGLKNLEYRGYDSAGIAIIGECIKTRKVAGRVEDLSDLCSDLSGNMGIAHTRWATHGVVSDENAHPHTDCKGEIAIVHNGIIENYKELREELIRRGHKFESDTDSEVIAHLIEDNLRTFSFEEACKRAFLSLKGSFAVLVVKEGERSIIGVRKDSPLVLGIATHGIFLASDIPSFLEWTKNVVYLHNYDFIVAKEGGFRVENLLEGAVYRPIDTVEWDYEQAKKGEYEHFMLKEITEQAETIKRAIQQDEEVIESVIEAIKNAFGVFFVGCGSSYHACLAGSYLFSRIARKHVNATLASEFENYEHFLTEETLVLAVSQSGETADVLEAVRAAKRRGSKVLSIVNVINSSLTRESDAFISMNSGPEICVLSTKTYTSQVTLMSMLAHALAGKYEEFVSEVKSLYMDIYNLTSRAMREHLCGLAQMLAHREHIYLIGRGLQYATALEAALKIKEVSYIHAEAFAGGELKHGPLALIEKGTPVIAFVSKENDKIIANISEVKTRGGFVIGVSSHPHHLFDYWIKVPESDGLNPVVQIIPMQILAYQLAVIRGLDPDKPRNLAKSVTVL